MLLLQYISLVWKHPVTAVDGLLCFRHYYTGIAPPDKILKATAIFYADLDVFPSGKEYIYIFFCIHYEFPSILILSSVKSAFTFSTIDSYIMTLQVLSGCLTIFTIHVEFWKQAQKKPTVSTNQMFILGLLLTAIITELRMFASYPYDISYCCYA